MNREIDNDLEILYDQTITDNRLQVYAQNCSDNNRAALGFASWNSYHSSKREPVTASFSLRSV